MRYVLLLLTGCACPDVVHTLDSKQLCVESAVSINLEDVERAVRAVEYECSMSFAMDLAIAFFKNAPYRSEGYGEALGLYSPTMREVRVWAPPSLRLNILAHELIHAGRDHAGLELDALHTDQTLWVRAGGPDSCQGRALQHMVDKGLPVAQ